MTLTRRGRNKKSWVKVMGIETNERARTVRTDCIPRRLSAVA